MNRVRLGDISNVTAGQAAPQDVDAFGSRGLPFIRAGSLEKLCSGTSEQELELISEEQACKYRLKKFPANTVVFAKSGMSATLGRVHRLSQECYLVSHLAAVTPASDLDSGYLQRWFEAFSPARLIENKAYPSIRTSTIQQIKIPLPPLAEQRRIADILNRADALRTKRRAALAQLDTLTQSIFLEMFGDPVTNPRLWPIVEFGSLCKRVTVGIVVKPASYYVDSGVPALRSLNIKPGKIVLDNLVYFSPENNDHKLSKTKLMSGDLVIVRSGQPGTAAIVPAELDGINTIDLLIASPHCHVCDSDFICAFFNSKGGRDLVLSKQRGQVQKHLNVGCLSSAKIPLPPLNLQKIFSSRVEKIEKLKCAQLVSLKRLNCLFSSIQHRAFQGEL